MKKIIIILLILIPFAITFNSCNEDDEVLSKEKVELISKNGFKVANSVNDLRSEIYILKDLNEDEHLEITKIEYSYFKKFSFADISYKTKNGKESNIIYTDYNLKMNTTKGCEVGCDCYQVSCSGSGCCRVKMTVPEDGGSPTFECTCNECTMHVFTKPCP
ncbi:hypothetical protein NMK71_07805 [Weeksellaceae bacterium KMM 9713]|uniref:Lipoprotein n=1 Tax=Profundicola chukchiensis TaxID=2961959 RepID=A0A9X4N3S5_9FLAO|nr:hypothetical protein [Profundicola chukchiensis]MDG4946314.1 hypothetical protein [Profundicola chukchiensis]MDG4950854.1 hypothetical protein [Profundicola chukchiensis]